MSTNEFRVVAVLETGDTLQIDLGDLDRIARTIAEALAKSQEIAGVRLEKRSIGWDVLWQQVGGKGKP